MDLPDDPGARWMALMRHGAWDAAWRLSDAALTARGAARDWTLPRHLQAVWQGAPLAGRRVLVRCYHGLGDTIMFMRLIPALQAIAADVTVWAQPALIPLLSTMANPPRFLPLHDGTPEADYDLDIEIMELAHALRIVPGALPGRAPWLRPPARPRLAAPGELAVGLVWRAGDWDMRRSVPPELLAPLASMPGVALHILQRGAGRAEWRWGGAETGTDDALEAAARMRALDLVISVDSMPSHLAGAIGAPVWLLLAHEGDWRWMEHRGNSPWYPTMRIFRQHAHGDWQAPVAAVLDALS